MERTVAFVLYQGITALDLVGPLQVLEYLCPTLGLRNVVVASAPGPVDTDTALRLVASHGFGEVRDPFAVVVPGGGTPTFRAMTDSVLLDYLRRVAPTAQIVASVCTGSLLLAAAGLLDGRRATTHWRCRDVLARLGAIPVERRWVEDGPFLTAAGVSAGIDMALRLATRLGGDEMARTIQYMLEYDPRPPHGPLDWNPVAVPAFPPVAETMGMGAAGEPELYARLFGRPA